MQFNNTNPLDHLFLFTSFVCPHHFSCLHLMIFTGSQYIKVNVLLHYSRSVSEWLQQSLKNAGIRFMP